MSSIFQRFSVFIRPIIALVVALLLGAVIIAVVQRDAMAPLTAYGALFRDAFGSATGFAGTLRLTTPLLLTGLAVAVALSAGLFNIGAEGQLAVGALAAALVGSFVEGLPAPFALFLASITGMIVGGIWSFLPIYLKQKRGAHEVITAILLNYVAQSVTRYLATVPLRDPSGQAPQTRAVTAFFPRLLPAYDVHAGLFLALLAVVVFAIAFSRTVWGYETRAVGRGRDAAETAGIAVRRVEIRAMLLSGALAGLAGAVTVLGEVPFRRFPADFYGIGYGFEGLAIALLASPSGYPSFWAVVPSALLFGGLSAGGEAMAFDTSTPRQIISVIQAVLIVAVAARFALPRLRRKAATS